MRPKKGSCVHTRTWTLSATPTICTRQPPLVHHSSRILAWRFKTRENWRNVYVLTTVIMNWFLLQGIWPHFSHSDQNILAVLLASAQKQQEWSWMLSAATVFLFIFSLCAHRRERQNLYLGMELNLWDWSIFRMLLGVFLYAVSPEDAVVHCPQFSWGDSILLTAFLCRRPFKNRNFCCANSCHLFQCISGLTHSLFPAISHIPHEFFIHN